ncbi:MAG: DUF3761 domain-containing protein [Acidobacteria bacterium]|nr:DUF3761 domain-containing protein [Acidobacteriota bacterium]
MPRLCSLLVASVLLVAPVVAASPASGCPAGTYQNVSHKCVPSPTKAPKAPVGASARCRDGSYSFSQHRSGTCSGHGGVAVWLTATSTSTTRQLTVVTENRLLATTTTTQVATTAPVTTSISSSSTSTTSTTLRATTTTTLAVSTTTVPAITTSTTVSATPSGATAICKDGSLSYSSTRSGTCSHHGGVAIWL